MFDDHINAQHSLFFRTGLYEESYMKLQPHNQSFLQYAWYLVNLNSYLFRRPPRQLILV